MYEVGQIIYVVSNETERIVPVMVTEEIKRKTMQGEELSYIVKHGNNEVVLSKIPGEVFTSVEASCEFLRKKFEDFLEKQVEWTNTYKSTLFDKKDDK